MRTVLEPLAFQILRRHLEGEPVQKIAAELGIPVERVCRRLAAATLLWGGTRNVPNWPTPARQLGISSHAFVYRPGNS